MSAPASGRFIVSVEERTVYEGIVHAPGLAAAKAIVGFILDDRDLLEREFFGYRDEEPLINITVAPAEVSS